jgi:hypothetical protein
MKKYKFEIHAHKIIFVEDENEKDARRQVLNMLKEGKIDIRNAYISDGWEVEEGIE